MHRENVIALVILLLAGCRLEDRDPEIRTLRQLLIEGDWSRFSEVYYPGAARPVSFLSLGLVVHDGNRMSLSWTVREPDFVELTTFKNEIRRYRWYDQQRLLAYCRPGFNKPFLMAPDNTDYEEALRRAREAGVYDCDAAAVLSIAGAEIERLPDSTRTPRSVDLRGVELSWQIKNAIRALRTIEKINLSCTPIQDSDLDYVIGLDGVRELNLANTNITDLGLANLPNLQDIQTLRLGGSRVSAGGIAGLERKLPGVEIDTSVIGC